MNKTIFFHIGSSKTGSTAIQSFLSKNRPLLVRDGFLYPGKEINHRKMIQEVARSQKEENVDLTITKEILEEIHQHSDHKVIISAEGLGSSNFTYYPEYMYDVFRQFLDLDYNFRIIMYLRRQDHHYEALYKQHIKGALRRESLMPEEFLKSENIRDYLEVLYAWSKYFEKENITVRVFEKGQIHDNVIIDFLSTIGLDITEEYSFPDRKESNITPDPICLEILRYCNQARIPLKTHMDLVHKMSELPKLDDQSSYFSPSQRINILEKVDRDNRKIAIEYLGREDGILFREPLPDPSQEWESPLNPELEKIIPALVQLLLPEKRKLSPKSKAPVQIYKEPSSEKRYIKIEKDLETLNKKLGQIQNSYSLKLGLLLTYPFRMIFKRFPNQ